MRIIISRITPKVSGAEMYNIHLLREIIKHKPFSVRVITNNDQFIKILQSLSVQTKKFNPIIGEVGTKKELLKAILFSVWYVPAFIREIKSNSTNHLNVVLMQSMTEKLFLTGILKILNYKIIWIEHGPLFITSRSAIIKLLYKISSIFVNKIIAVSDDTKHDLINGGIRKKKIETLYIGIDIQKFDKKAKEKTVKKMTQKEYFIGFVGTVGLEKGILRFLEVAELMLKADKNIKFVVFGDGPLLAKSKEIVKRRKIDEAFTFYGYVENIEYYLKNIDVMFLPTDHYEGISLAILESIAAGVIVYTHDIGGNKEIISNRKTGFLYKDYNKESIAQEILSLLRDEKMKNRILRDSKIYLKHRFDIKKNILDFMKLFSSV